MDDMAGRGVLGRESEEDVREKKVTKEKYLTARKVILPLQKFTYNIQTKIN